MKILWVLSFLLIISLPLIFLDTKSIVSEQENRNLAAFPQFIEAGRLNLDTLEKSPRLLDAYLNDRFGFRNTAVSWAHAFNKAAKTINGYVVFGKNDWLFYSKPEDGNNINDFFKINLFTDAEIKRFITNIERRLEWCTDNNIKFIFLIAPNKHNVYPEYYPFERPKGITRTEQLITALPDHLKDMVIYPLEDLIKNKTDTLPLYFETGTHWNMAGAYQAYDILYNRVKQMFPNTNFPEIEFTLTSEIKYNQPDVIDGMPGYQFNYKKITIPDLHPAEGWDSFYHYIKNEEKNGIIIQNEDKILPTAIIYRDSFFMALEPFTSTLFSQAEYHWRWFTEVEKEYILKNKPDLIIWEVVERNIRTIPNSRWN